MAQLTDELRNAYAEYDKGLGSVNENDLTLFQDQNKWTAFSNALNRLNTILGYVITIIKENTSGHARAIYNEGGDPRTYMNEQAPLVNATLQILQSEEKLRLDGQHTGENVAGWKDDTKNLVIRQIQELQTEVSDTLTEAGKYRKQAMSQGVETYSEGSIEQDKTALIGFSQAAEAAGKSIDDYLYDLLMNKGDAGKEQAKKIMFQAYSVGGEYNNVTQTVQKKYPAALDQGTRIANTIIDFCNRDKQIWDYIPFIKNLRQQTLSMRNAEREQYVASLRNSLGVSTQNLFATTEDGTRIVSGGASPSQLGLSALYIDFQIYDTLNQLKQRISSDKYAALENAIKSGNTGELPELFSSYGNSNSLDLANEAIGLRNVPLVIANIVKGYQTPQYMAFLESYLNAGKESNAGRLSPFWEDQSLVVSQSKRVSNFMALSSGTSNGQTANSQFRDILSAMYPDLGAIDSLL